MRNALSYVAKTQQSMVAAALRQGFSTAVSMTRSTGRPSKSSKASRRSVLGPILLEPLAYAGWRNVWHSGRHIDRSRQSSAWLWEVRLATDSIAALVQSRSFADCAADLMLRSAVERQFEIAGEALNRLSREEASEIAAQLPDLRHAVALRNALIHGYREVGNATVWQTINESTCVARADRGIAGQIGDHP
jgi:uncharacterized protein with HEPN domain